MTSRGSSAPKWERPDPFADEAIRRIRYVGQLDASDLPVHARKQEVHAKHLGIPLGLLSRFDVPAKNPVSDSEVVIETNGAVEPLSTPYGEDVQHPYVPATKQQRAAFDTLRDLEEPVTVGDFSDAHDCSEATAARWLRFFCAKRVLMRRDDNRPGHYFARGVK